MTIEAAENRVGILRDAQRRHGVFRRSSRMAQRSTGRASFPEERDPVFDELAVPDGNRCDGLGSRAEHPFDQRGSRIASLLCCDTNSAVSRLILKADSGTLADRLRRQQLSKVRSLG